MSGIIVTTDAVPITVTPDASAPITVTLALPSAEVIVTPVGLPGRSAPAHVHEQAQPASTWTIAHGFSYRPLVGVVDTAGDECEGAVTHPEPGVTTITFSAPFAGVARLI